MARAPQPRVVRSLAATAILAAALAGGAHAQSPAAGPAPHAAAIGALAAAQTGGNAFDYFGGLRYDPAVPSPQSVLGYPIGARFTRHSDLVEYCRRVSAASDRVRMAEYGRTHERRPLHFITISSPDNLARLDDILEHNRALADPATNDARAAEIIETNPAVVWFSYNVHGNEASCSEAAMQVLYTMAAATNTQVVDILSKVVFVIDPMINPDGRDRYVNWYNSVLGAAHNAGPDAAEHREPWPGGRTNHYHFDLNRDWLWLVHPESRTRLPVYRRYLPQLHIDYHEQGHRSPYFFGAGDEPYNTNIPDETRRWVELYGEANAKVFDARGLVYATKERFDYLYPGYGKVLPVYHGAVGMLTEQAGHGFAGLAIEIGGDNVLTLETRARNHFLTSMSYLETTAAQRKGQLERFRRFFTESMTPEADGPKGFFIYPDNDTALLQRVWDLCHAHGVRIERVTRDAEIPGLRSYWTGQDAESNLVPEGAWVIPAGQPMGRLARAIFERETTVTDIETYDITGWSVPLSFGLHAAYTRSNYHAPSAPIEQWRRPDAQETGDGSVAILVDANQHDFPVAVGLSVKHDLMARRTGGEVVVDARRFAAGSLIVYTIRNRGRDPEAFVRECLAAGLNVHRAASSMTTEGHVLGANDNGHYTLPKIMLLRDAPTSGNSFGQLWHYLDIQYPIPHTVVNVRDVSRASLHNYNVIVIPDASAAIGRELGESTVSAIKDWIRAGGAVVALGAAGAWANETFVPDLPKPEEEKDERPKPAELTWEQRRDRAAQDNIPGAMFRAKVDTTHPLSAGVGQWVSVLKRGERTLRHSDNAYIVARFDDDPFVGGYTSERNRDRVGGSPFMTHHRVGRGAVIAFSDDVSIRGFMHGPMRLVLNAIIYGAN